MTTESSKYYPGVSGTIINYSDIARSLGVSVPTVRDYFEIAHGTFLWRNVPSFEKKVSKRIIKHPKGYIRDSGLLQHLLRIRDTAELLAHSDGNTTPVEIDQRLCRGKQVPLRHCGQQR